MRLLEAGLSDPSEEDLAHMRKVVGYVHRHLAQRPDGDVEHTRWRYSLMNWGHDPLKDAAPTKPARARHAPAPRLRCHRRLK